MKEKKIKKIKFPWIIYGILFAPLELLIAYFSFLSKGEPIGLWVSLKIIVILSFVFFLIPIIARLIFRIFKKDFFDMTDIVKAIVPALVGLVILWIVAVLYATKNEGIISKILAVVFLMPIAILPHGIIFYVMYMLAGLFSGDKEFYDSLDRGDTLKSNKSNKNIKVNNMKKSSKNHIMRKNNQGNSLIFDEDGNVEGLSYKSNLGNNVFQDNDGKVIGTSQKDNFGHDLYMDSNGSVVGRSYKDNLGNTVYEDKDGKIVGTSRKDNLDNELYKSKN